MRDDLELIKIERPDTNELHIYGMGDLHVGSEQFDERAVRKKIQIIQNDPIGHVVLAGDLGDYGLKNSISNVYRQTMTPAEQQDYILDLLEPIKDKIACAVPGNHEARITRETSRCPLYDICVLLRIEDKYRENVAINKYSFGNQGNKQPNIFIGITTHGSSKNKHHKFMACYEGADFSFSAHVHSPQYNPLGRIRIERTSGTARLMPYKEVILDANLAPGGYALKNEYEVAPPPELPYLELKTCRDTNNRTRTLYRIMNYHTIQI